MGSCNDDFPYKLIEGFEQKCTKKCEGGKKYLDLELNECVARCPPERPNFVSDLKTCLNGCGTGYYIDTSNGECVKTCPSYNQSISGDEKKCVSECKDGYPFISFDGTKCLAQCDSQHPYTLKSGNQCIAQCPSDSSSLLIPDKKKCVGNCYLSYAPEHYFQIEGKSECVKVCPSSMPYTYENNDIGKILIVFEDKKSNNNPKLEDNLNKEKVDK